MTERLDCDICVIGAGSGGLSVAAGASQMGARTVLVEAAAMGGDCLNFGCVPSKALLAAAHAAQQVRRAGAFGIGVGGLSVDFAAVNDHVRAVIAAIAPNDSADRFEALGCTVIRAAGRFVDPATLQAGDRLIRARRFAIATGSAPVLPPVPGLAEVPCFTNETIFESRELPDSLIVLGAGPVGLELAQAYRRLGARVTVVDPARALGREDPELAAIAVNALRAEGVDLREGWSAERVSRQSDGRLALIIGRDGEKETVPGSHLLVAAGRRPRTEGLGLDAAGVAFSEKGISVDARLRTSNRRVFAIGDVAGGAQFTHLANYHAGIVLRNVLFRWPARADIGHLPRVVYTDPELAYVGLTEDEARARHGRIRILRFPFAQVDRAQAERRPQGHIKAITTARGRIVGAGIVGAHAGELILPWVMALQRGLTAGALANLVVPYPTLSEASRRVAGSFYLPRLLAPGVRRLVRLLARFG